MDGLELIITAAIVGIGGTLILDLYAVIMSRVAGMAAPDWRLVGRWLGHVARGRFILPDPAQAAPVPAEQALGWAFHYAVGVGYGLLIAAIWGASWLQTPCIVEPLMLSLALLVLPYFVLMPGMGLGMAGSKAQHPSVARIRSLIGHTVFAFGMFVTAWLMTATV